MKAMVIYEVKYGRKTPQTMHVHDLKKLILNSEDESE